MVGYGSDYLGQSSFLAKPLGTQAVGAVFERKLGRTLRGEVWLQDYGIDLSVAPYGGLASQGLILANRMRPHGQGVRREGRGRKRSVGRGGVGRRTCLPLSANLLRVRCNW